MKKLICVMLVLALAASFMAALSETYAYVQTPTSDGTVYVRAVAGAGQPILGYAKNGDALLILKKGNTWHKVRVLRTGLEGYMYGEYIRFTAGGSTASQPSYGWGDASGAVGSWGGSGKYTPDASVLDTDKVYNVDAVISSSDGYANLRWGPGMEYNIIGQVTNGTTVWALEKNGDWYRCATRDGKIGYISKSLLKVGSATASGAYGKTGVIRSSDGFAAVRAGAGTSHELLYTMKVGQSTSVYASSGQWMRVSREGGWGNAFIHRTLLRFNWKAVTTGDVNARKGPGTSYEKVGVLYNGTEVKLLATNGSFARVDTGSGIYYVSSRYLNY